MKLVQFRKGIWVLPVVVMALVAAHTGALYGVFCHLAWKLALGLILLVLLLHIGVLGSIYTSFRRWLTQACDSECKKCGNCAHPADP